jgi:adenylyltransferase/sulfurtransferase
MEGGTVGEVLQKLAEEYPKAGEVLFGAEGSVRSFVNVYLNDVLLHMESDASRNVTDGDELMLLPVIAGGSGSTSVISDERRKEVKLDDKEIDRYEKHLLLREIGVKGQKRIKAARVLIVGAGALGSPVALYLGAAGVGTIGIIDPDEVAPGNLQGQIAHGTRDIHRPKPASVKDAIRLINPAVKVETYNERLDGDNFEERISGYDVVVDATDQYVSRYLINDACVRLKKPEVFGAIYQYEGYVTVYGGDGPCFRCQFPSPPAPGLVPSCAQGGVISSLPGIIGSVQASEVLKLLIGGGDVLSGRMFYYDAWHGESRILKLDRRADCPVCGGAGFSIEEFDYEEFCGTKQETCEIPVEGITPEELASRLERGEEMTIVDVREPHERAIARFPDAIVIPIGQLARRQKELNPNIDTIFICREGKRSILAINTLREAGYKGPMYNLKGGMEAARNIIFSNEGAWL